MAVTITDNRTVVDEADSTTGWTGSNGVAVFTAAPDPVESTASLGVQVSNATEEAYYGLAAPVDLTDTLVYGWFLPGGVLDTTVNGGVQLVLGDGTDRAGFHVGGSDGAGFRHDDGPVTWQSFVIDTSQLSLLSDTTFAGTGATGLTVTSISNIGAAFKTLAKSVGGQENCFIDIFRYGNGGLTLTGGGAGTEGKFLEIAQSDRSTLNLTAYGIIRELGASLFGLQGALTFGDSVGTASVDFSDSDLTVIFEDRGFATNKYSLTVTGNATGTTSVIWNNITFTCPTGVGAALIATNTNVDTLSITNCTFANYDQSFDFTTGANGTGYTITDNIFNGCAQIGVGTGTFTGNSLRNSVGIGAVLLTTPTNNIDNCAFTSSGTGHAIVITTAGTYNFNNHSYTGYATVDGTTGNEVIYNNSGGAVTINVSGGDGPTIRNGTGATTTVNNPRKFRITNAQPGTEVRLFTNPGLVELGGGVELVEDTANYGADFAPVVGESPDANGLYSVEYSYNYSADQPIFVVAHSLEFQYLRLSTTLVNADTSLQINQTADRQYDSGSV